MKKMTSNDAGIGKGAKVVLILCLVAAIVFAAAAGSVVYFGRQIALSDRILPNVYASGIYIGDMTVEQAVKTLEENGWNEKVGGSLKVLLPENVSIEVDYMKSGAGVYAETIAKEAYELGHNGSYFSSLTQYLKGKASAYDAGTFQQELDTAYLESKVKEASGKFLEATVESAYVVDDENGYLIVKKGAGNMELNETKLLSAITDALNNRETETSFSEIEGTPLMPDFENIYKEIGAECKDAYYDPELDEVIEDSTGIEFDINKAIELWTKANALEEVKIPVEVTRPKVTAEELKETLFRDLLGEQETFYHGSTANRINNIQLAASKITGIILMPGDEFSYNETVGQRTEEAGFRAAGAYSDGAVVMEVGGGICQVSSTLYAAVLRANLEIVARTCHQFIVSYLPIGIDATVSWPRPDFKFKNNSEYPIKLILTTDTENKSVKAQIWGTNLDGGYCEAVSGWYAINDEEYTSTQIGWGATSFRKLYDKDGNLLDKVWEANSRYDLHPEEIKWPPEYYEKQEAEKDKDKESGEVIIDGGNSGGTTPGGESGGDAGTTPTEPAPASETTE